ncbi:FAD-dependent oxidoreductase [Streptomyces sp. NPDC059781]|uniref:FAD-dependent oxidoreductase n=1 Tax=Streptomyces sp. NPDC059781 TaxID=3346943 RepID=UPI003649F008
MSEPSGTEHGPLPRPAGPADPEVAIVGAGPAGLLLGLLLGLRGRRVLLIEREEEPVPGGPGNGICPILQPATLGILDRLGLLPELAANTTPVTHGEVAAGGATVASYAYADLPGAPVAHALPTSIVRLRDVLAAAVRALPGTELVYGATVRALVRREGAAPGVRGLELEDARGVRTLYPSLIVGCDGKRSAVREMAGIGAPARAFKRGYTELRLPLPGSWGPVMRAAFTADGYVLGTPIADETLLFAWITDPDTAGEAVDGPLEALAERYARAAPQAADWIREHTTDRSQVREFLHHIVRPERWTDGNVVLVGDSAHGVHVYGGQGLNLSLQDAACVASAADEAMTAGDTAALHRFEALRRPFTEAFQDMQEAHLDALAARAGRAAGGDAGGGAGHLPDFAPLALGQSELRAAFAAAVPEGVPSLPAVVSAGTGARP